MSRPIEEQPLLHDDSPTAEIQKKLRTWHQFHALELGYMPTNEQVNSHLASLLASPALDSKQRGLSLQTKQILEDFKSVLRAFVNLIKEKNEGELFQEILYNLKKARLDFSVGAFAIDMTATAAKADAKLAGAQAQVIGDMMYSNPRFRSLLHDLSILGRDVLADAVEATAQAIEPDEADLIQLEEIPSSSDAQADQNDAESSQQVIEGKFAAGKQRLAAASDKVRGGTHSVIHESLRQAEGVGRQISDGANQASQMISKSAQEVDKRLPGIDDGQDASITSMEGTRQLSGELESTQNLKRSPNDSSNVKPKQDFKVGDRNVEENGITPHAKDIGDREQEAGENRLVELGIVHPSVDIGYCSTQQPNHLAELGIVHPNLDNEYSNHEQRFETPAPSIERDNTLDADISSGRNLSSSTSEETASAVANVKETSIEIDAQLRSTTNRTMDAIHDTTKKIKASVPFKDTIQKTVDDVIQTTGENVQHFTGIPPTELRGKFDSIVGQTRETAQTLAAKANSISANTKDSVADIAANVRKSLQQPSRRTADPVEEAQDSAGDITQIVQSAKQTGSEVKTYITKKFPPKRRAALRSHFSALARSLQDNADYTVAFDGIISLVRKYVHYLMTIAVEAPSDAADALHANQNLKRAARLTLTLLEHLSGGRGFRGVQAAYQKLARRLRSDKEAKTFVDDCVLYAVKIIQDMKFAASEDAETHAQDLYKRMQSFSEHSALTHDIDDIFKEVLRLVEGFASDKFLVTMAERSRILFRRVLVNEHGDYVLKKRVIRDVVNILLPSALRLVQYLPIPRFEYQDADIDLVVENMVFESSASHDQSFLPHVMRIENQNVVEFVNAYKFETDYANRFTIKIEGLSLAVRDAGFYFRKKTGLFRIEDSGFLDILMDGPGINIDIDLQMSTDDEDSDVTKDALFIIKDVKVNIRKFTYSISGAKYGWLLVLMKPFIRAFIRRQLNKVLGSVLKEQIGYLEYQVRMFKHRVKTAAIANNGQASFASYLKSIFTANAGTGSGRKGQFSTAFGLTGPLRDIRAPGSLIREVEESEAIVDDQGQERGWKNQIFD